MNNIFNASPYVSPSRALTTDMLPPIAESSLRFNKKKKENRKKVNEEKEVCLFITVCEN